jgi:hypothetical protein
MAADWRLADASGRGWAPTALVGLPPPDATDTGRAAQRQGRTVGEVGQAHGFEPAP